MKMQDKVSEAEQHINTLEELRDKEKVWLSYYKEHDKVIAYDEARNIVNALDFAIDFIKWGMK